MVITLQFLRLGDKILHLYPYFRLRRILLSDCYMNRLHSWLTIRIWPPNKPPKYHRSMKIVIAVPFLRLEHKIWHLYPYFLLQRIHREWLLCETTTALADNSNMAARQVSEIPQKSENGHNSSIFEVRRKNLTSVPISYAMGNTQVWLLCESTTIWAYNSNMAAG